MGAKLTQWLVGAIFALIGAIFLIIGVIMAKSGVEFRSHAEEGIAVISDVESYRNSKGETRHRVYVFYTVDGREYEQALNYYSSGMYEGKEVKIYYDPKAPYNIQAKGAAIVELIFIIVGGIFFIIGLCIIFIKVHKNTEKRKLLETGQRIYAQIEEVRLNTSYRVNGRHPFLIICKWIEPATGKVYYFKSENLWYDPKQAIEERGIQKMPVYIDVKNPRKYMLSLENQNGSEFK